VPERLALMGLSFEQLLALGTPYEQSALRYMVENRLLSLYERHGDGSGVCYASRLRPLVNMRPRYNKPALRFKGTHQFNEDLYLVDWLEVRGYRFDVATDEDLHAEGAALLKPYRVVLSGSHPEYWTGPMLEGLEGYLQQGGRLMYLGGNGFYWVTSVDPERPHVIEVRRAESGIRTWQAAPGEYYHSTTGELGGLWRFRGRAPQRVVGVGFSAAGSDRAYPYRRQPGSFDPRAAFIFEGIGRDEIIGDFGLHLGGAAGWELDRADAALGTPRHALVLASSFGHSDAYLLGVEEVWKIDSRLDGTVNPLVRADMVYFEGPNEGGVFSTGSISWCGSLSHNGYRNNVSQITENVLKRFTTD
jgi:N,N-dimethylformamidase